LILRPGLADVLHRINDDQASRLEELMPWNWQRNAEGLAA